VTGRPNDEKLGENDRPMCEKSGYSVELRGKSSQITNRQWIEALAWLEWVVRESSGEIEALRILLKS
jgi:hypothetical protein